MAHSKPGRKKSPKRILALPDLEHAKTAVLTSLTSVSGQRTYDHGIRSAALADAIGGGVDPAAVREVLFGADGLEFGCDRGEYDLDEYLAAEYRLDRRFGSYDVLVPRGR